MNDRSAYFRGTVRRRSSAQSVWRFGKMIVLVGLVGAVGWLFFQKTVHNQLRDTIQAQLDQKTAGSSLSTNLANAHFIEGQGIGLRDLKLTVKGSDESAAVTSKIEIYEAFMHAPVSLTQLVSCKTKPTAIEVRRAKIQLQQSPKGDWYLPELIKQLQSLKDPQCGPIPVSFSDCAIEFVDPYSENKLQLADVALEILPILHDGRPLLQIRGQLNSQLISGTQFTAFFDIMRQTWFIENFSIAQLRLSKTLLNLLPARLRNTVDSLPNIDGLVQLNGSATGDLNFDSEPEFKFSGSLTEFSCDDPFLPLPIRKMKADFEVNNREFHLTNVMGKLGQGHFDLEYHQTGLMTPRQWSTAGRFEDFDFTHHQRFSRILPGYCGRLCDEYSPAGLTNIQFDLSHNGTRLHRTIRARLTDTSFSYIKLPYRVDHCVGEVSLVNDVCEFEIRNSTGQQHMKLEGSIQNPGPDATYKIKILVPDELPIDDKMLTALQAQPKLWKIINDFNPTGRVSGLGWIIKQIPGGTVSKSFDVRLKQCNVRHNSFDYPIHNVSGLVQARNDEYTFVELAGSNSSAQINCNGDWNPTNGLKLTFGCESVPFDDQLRFSLRPELREIWQGLRPRGTVDHMRVDMTLPIGQSVCDVTVDATMSKPVPGVESNFISINPIWFPYEIKRLTGNVKIGDGKIQLTDMEGLHGRTWVVCQGDGHYADDSWSVKLKNMLVTSLKVDEDLIAALPSHLAPPIRQLAFNGLLNVHGEITVAGKYADELPAQRQSNRLVNLQTQTINSSRIRESSNSLAWNLRFDMNQASMVVGLPLENVFGKVNLVGQYDGTHAACRGELNIDSLTIYDAQITKIKGPIWLDNEHTAAGVFVKNSIDTDADNISPLTTRPDGKTSVTGAMHGGVVNFDAQMGSDPNGEFYLQTTLADGNLKQFCREFAPHLTDISGRSFAALRLAGNYLGTHSYRGEGSIQLRDAKIYELPVMLSLLKILKVGHADRTAFDASNAEFTVSGEDIDFRRIEMLGDAISLVGNGTLNLDRDINLNFYSVMGRNKINIPLISDLYRASSQQILWINVNGTLDNPRTHRNVLPQINDSLRQLFQSPQQNNIARNWNPERQADRTNEPGDDRQRR